MSNKEFCSQCGATITEYKHSLGKGLLRALVKFAKHASSRGAAVNLNDCNMNLSERTNFYKLKYWGLLEKASDNERGGEWVMLPIGWAFVEGRIEMRKLVWSYRGEFVRFDGERVYIQDVTDGWKYRPDYVRERRPYDPQQPLL